MSTSVIVQDSFLACAYALPQEIAKEVFKTLRNLAENPQAVGLHVEKLRGQTTNLWVRGAAKDAHDRFGLF